MTPLTPQPEGAHSYAAVPQLDRICREVLPGDAWPQLELAHRDRIFVTLGVLAAGGKVDEMKVWLGRALDPGITLDEVRGLVAQVTFYAGLARGSGCGKGGLGLDRSKSKTE